MKNFFLLLFLVQTALFGFNAQQFVNKIADVTAINIYNVEPETASSYVSLMVEKNHENIIALRYLDAIDDSPIYEYYDNESAFKKLLKNPKKIQKYKKITKDVVYDGEVVGKLILYFRKGLELMLTPHEKAWIQKHPVIHVGGEMDWAPFDFIDDEGNYNGLARDYLTRLAQMCGFKVEFHTGKPWNALLAALEHGEIDLLPALYFDESRTAYTQFTNPYLSLAEYFFTQENTPKIEDIKELKGKTLAVVKGYTIVNWIEKNYPEIHLNKKDTIVECLKSVQSGESRAFIGDNPSTTYNIEANFLTGIVINGVVKQRKPIKIYMGVKKEYAPLAIILNKALAFLSQEEKSKINAKWMSLLNTGKITLTNEQKAWLLKNEAVPFVYDPKWKPFEWRDKVGLYQGIIADIIKLIGHKSGITFRPADVTSWQDAIADVKSKKALMFSGIGETKERKAYLNFTQKPFLSTPYVFLTKEKTNYLNGFEDVKEKRVAVVKDYTIDGILKEHEKNFPLVRVKNINEGFNQLDNGDIDVFIVNAISAKYYKSIFRNRDIYIAYKTQYNLSLKIALRKDAPKEILEIINKTIHSMSQKEVDDIIYKWTKTKTSWRDYLSEILEALSVVLLIILFILWNARKLKLLVKEKTADLEELSHNLEKKVLEKTEDLRKQKDFVQTLLDSQEQIIVTTDGKKLLTANETFFDFFAVDTVEEFMQAYDANCICDTFNTNAPEGYLQVRMGEEGRESWVDYVISRSFDIEPHKAMISMGSIDFIFSVSAAKLPGEGGIKAAVFTNITEMEKTKLEIEAINKHTRESIEYASLIQGALIPDHSVFRNYFSDYFAIWHPKDTVGGDIYLFEELRHKDECLLMVIDCTGHGVPGAFVTMLVKAIERQITAKINNDPDEVVSPAKILSIFNKNMKQLLKQESVDSVSNAGFDGGILYYNKKEKVVKFAGAETPLFYVEENEQKMIKGTRYSVGYKKCSIDYEYKEHTIAVKEGMQFYLTTDGYLDQNGGEKGFPFGKKRFKKIIEAYHQESMADQQEIFLNELETYQQEEIRNDDVTLIGLKI